MSAMAGSSRGDFETQQLRANVEEQLQRLLTQLEDLDELRDEMDDGSTRRRAETMQQLEEFEQSLEKMKEGNMTLVSELNSVQLAIQTTIRNAFKTPEVIKMFARRAEALRSASRPSRASDAQPPARGHVPDAVRRDPPRAEEARREARRRRSTPPESVTQHGPPRRGSTAIGDTVEKDMMNRAARTSRRRLRAEARGTRDRDDLDGAAALPTGWGRMPDTARL